MLASQAPHIFHCSAGKDRTGIAAALILTALNVPRETRIEDYLLTNRDFDSSRTVIMLDEEKSQFDKLPPEVLHASILADRRYIEAVLDMVDRHPGG